MSDRGTQPPDGLVQRDGVIFPGSLLRTLGAVDRYRCPLPVIKRRGAHCTGIAADLGKRVSTFPDSERYVSLRDTIRAIEAEPRCADGSCSMAIPASGRGTDKRRPRWIGAGLGREAKDDDRVVSELYRQYYSPLMAFVLRLTAGVRQQPEDVVQETMLRAWRQGGSLDQNAASLMPWLATVARRIVIDEQRRKDARPPETGEDRLEKASVTDLTDDVLRSVIVTDALRALSASHRQVLNETILSDRTVNEAAAVLGIPVGTVKSRVYYALRALRLVLAEQGVSM